MTNYKATATEVDELFEKVGARANTLNHILRLNSEGCSFRNVQNMIPRLIELEQHRIYMVQYHKRMSAAHGRE